MRFRTILTWTLGYHLLAIGLAYFIQPKKATSPPKLMRSVTVQLKPQPVPIQPQPAPRPPTPEVKKTARTKGKAPTKKQVTAKPKNARSTPPPAPMPPVTLPIDYQQLLAQRLKEQLALPEIGAVEIKITFGKNGAIEKVEVIASQSAANSRYLVSAIQKIELPLVPRNLRGNCEPLLIEFSSSGNAS